MRGNIDIKEASVSAFAWIDESVFLAGNKTSLFSYDIRSLEKRVVCELREPCLKIMKSEGIDLSIGVVKEFVRDI